MKKFLNIILSVSVLCLFFSCSKDNEPEKPEDPKLELYYSYQDTTRHLLSDNDVITINLGDTFSIFADITNITGDNLVILGKNSFEYEKTGDYKYQFVAQNAGLFNMGAFTYDQETGEDFITYFEVNVHSFSYEIFTIESTFSIGAETESLKDAIQTELEDTYAPEFRPPLTLTCKTTTGGDLEFVTAEKETVTGTFTTSNVFDLTDITMYYNNFVYAFTLEKSDIGPAHYLLKQDLTEEFRAKYPTETISEVTITTLSIINKMK
ncbi:MAG: hypothetical protein AB2L24_10540 [Mangrovibacterium sp.]